MAQTYTVITGDIPPALNKTMLGIFNPTSSGRVIRVYRIGLNNTVLSAVTGVMLNFGLYYLTAMSGSHVLSFISHDSSDAAMPGATGIAAYTGSGGITTSTLLRRIAWSSDEVGVSGINIEEYEAFQGINTIWDAGYGDSNIQPLTLRENQGVGLKCLTSTTVGTTNVWAEMTIETT